MPYIRIETNIPKDKIPSSFTKEVSTLLAKTIGKPEIYCSVGVAPGMMLIFAGTDDPCAQVTLMSIGRLGVAENKEHSKILFEKIRKDLGIDSKRMYITYNDVPASHVGFDGTTFHALFQ